MHAFYLHEAWRSFRHHRGLAMTAILALTGVLTVAGVFLLLAFNARTTMRMVGDRREMVVYLKDEVTRDVREAMIVRLRSLYGDVTYVSKEEAWQEFSDQIGDPQLLESVDGNPLPASLRIKLRPELLNYPAMEQTAKQLEQFPEVEDVRFGGDWVKRLDALGRTIERGAIVVGSLVALVIVFVLYTTIRLTVVARRPQVEIMSRLGATDRFVATPFIVEAMLQAGIAATLALGFMFAVQQAFVARIVPIAFLPWPWIGMFLGSALLLGWIASLLALSRVLRSVGA